ncbi:MAG: DUF554 domain-containing protein [Verrucomicrobia bacterium]|nr:DUF554 domain-containing protein [Verrucomicrobiota bacterium]
MTGLGTAINAAGILLGGVLGLTFARQIPESWQLRIRALLALFIIYAGLSLTWKGVNGPFGQVAKQMGIVMLALVLGNATGRLLRLQRGMNALGRYARERFAKADPANKQFSEGFVTCTLVFCLGPMAILGPMEDALSTPHTMRILLIKTVMDGLATMGFVAAMGWGPILSVIPVVAYQGSITLLATALEPYLRHQDLLDAVNATGGLIVFTISLVVLEVKRVELANYLPSLLWAPLLTWWWR